MKSIKGIHKLKEFFDTIVFPSTTCALCDRPIHLSNNHQDYLLFSQGNDDTRLKRMAFVEGVCLNCKQQLTIPSAPFCSICHKPVDDATQGKANQETFICSDCQDRGISYLSLNRSATLYHPFMREKIALFKFRGKESLAKVFGQFLAIVYDQYYREKEIEIITCIPLHPNRMSERGFNQSEKLAIELSRYAGVPLIDTLIRVKDTDKQSKRNKHERLIEMKDSFQVKDEMKSIIKNKTILLIDDIYTTGSTLKEGAKVLREAGAKVIYGLTLARAIEQKIDDKLDFIV